MIKKDNMTTVMDQISVLKELRHDILIHFFDGLSYSWSVRDLKKWLANEEKHQKKKGTRMAEDGEDWNGLEMTILNSLAIFFQNTRTILQPL